MKKLFIFGIVLLTAFALFTCSGGKSLIMVRPEDAQLHSNDSKKKPLIVKMARMDLIMKYYKDCSKIELLERFDFTPESMLHKKMFAPGDKWTEKWKINACGTIAVHEVKLDVTEIRGRYGIYVVTKPAEYRKKGE